MSKVERVREIIAQQQALEEELHALVGEDAPRERRKYTRKEKPEQQNGAAPEEATLTP